ncbi:MAG: hypothetical protein QM802_01905 [Agriterribacter sp.]
MTVFFTKQSYSQYYYRDILLPAQNMVQQQLYKKTKVTQVTLMSYEADGSTSDGFECTVTPNYSYSQLKTLANTEATGSSSLTAFYNFKGQLYKSVDSSNEMVTTYSYAFDSSGKLVNASNSSYTPANKQKQSEMHQWLYTGNGNLEQMIYINGADTVHVKFALDENDNIAEEEQWQKNISKGKTYYYYDSLHHLTDIVRYNEKLKRLMPDYMFEYNGNGQLTKMITVDARYNDYITWLYEYDEKGLRTTERCYNKQKRLVGRITYEYTFK